MYVGNLGSVDKFVKTMKLVIVEKLVIYEKCLIGEKPVTGGRPVLPCEPLAARWLLGQFSNPRNIRPVLTAV